MDGNISEYGETTTVVLSLTRKRQASSPADVECSSSSTQCSDSSTSHKRPRMADPSQHENLGITVKLKLCFGPLGGDLSAELPFILMDLKPEEEAPLPAHYPAPHHDHDLIQLDSHPGENQDEHADDQILDDLARLRLKGAADSDA